jgi:hypothetical protein
VKLQQSLANLNTSRASKDPQALHIISTAYAALHNVDSARRRGPILLDHDGFYHPTH